MSLVIVPMDLVVCAADGFRKFSLSILVGTSLNFKIGLETRVFDLSNSNGLGKTLSILLYRVASIRYICLKLVLRFIMLDQQ